MSALFNSIYAFSLVIGPVVGGTLGDFFAAKYGNGYRSTAELMMFLNLSMAVVYILCLRIPFNCKSLKKLFT